MAYGAVLTALADPTRRLIFERVRERPRAVGELARLARVSQPAASQHLRVLREARLVEDRAEGTRRLYRARREGLAQLRAYLEAMWDEALVAFANSGDDAR